MSRRTSAIGIGALVAIVIGVVVALSVGNTDSVGGPPKFRPAPGKFRLTPHLPGNGIPPRPTMLTRGSERLSVAFGGAFEDRGRVVAALVVTAAGDTRVAGRYPKGAVITAGDVRLRVLGVYDQPGEDSDAVDVQLAAR